MVFWEKYKPISKLKLKSIVMCAVRWEDKNVLFCGCHSGGILTVNIGPKKIYIEKESSHKHIVRNIVMLQQKQLASIDVIGTIITWQPYIDSVRKLQTIAVNAGVGYNSFIAVHEIPLLCLASRNQELVFFQSKPLVEVARC
jgi:hypothetical protein